ncbi:hypothetical protein F383_10775 [Gossypium arboreum]|uniref:Uncharacterized protein n=1 Tax=Gossypium arboreum TaxID=29729 RepID=A0A0B0PPA7_GOSAR|nr:hypothetical protein F383_10775 [Gossypium arboreum]
MTLCWNEFSLNMFRSRTKEIRFGSRENQSCRIIVPFRLSLFEVSS